MFGSKDIPPLKQTIDEVIAEYREGIILKMVDENDVIIGSVRAKESDGTKGKMRSIYLRDPDGNLIELASYG